MTLIDELKVMNYSIIDYLKAKGISIKKNELIKEILKDEACFFKMEKEEAFVILRTLQVSDDMMEKTYKELTSRQEFNRLYNEGKIDENQNELKIKYEVYNTDLFKSVEQDKKNSNNLEENNKALIKVEKKSIFEKIKSFLGRIFH